MIKKLLYLTYITLEDVPKTGSSVRPLKMKNAFESLDIEVRTFGGISNNIQIRKKTVKEILGVIKTWKPDACYIEPPSGPLFYYGDIILIKKLHKMGIPMSIFYRDAYWKYPEYSAEKKLSLVDKIKRFVIKIAQKHQWNVYKTNMDIIYFPSYTMAKEFDCPRKEILPPGGFEPNSNEKKVLSKPLQFIFVGGAARNHGTFLTLEAFEKLNKSEIRGKVTYVCPKAQWDGLGIDKDNYKGWLEVIHTSGDDNLKQLYERADVALLTAPRTFYRDFAVPIKIFEYISYLKPVLVTDCTETAKIVDSNHVGWVTKDDVESVYQKLQDLCDNPEKIIMVREHMKEVRGSNLWISRAEKVISDLNL